MWLKASPTRPPVLAGTSAAARAGMLCAVTATESYVVSSSSSRRWIVTETTRTIGTKKHWAAGWTHGPDTGEESSSVLCSCSAMRRRRLASPDLRMKKSHRNSERHHTHNAESCSLAALLSFASTTCHSTTPQRCCLSAETGGTVIRRTQSSISGRSPIDWCAGWNRVRAPRGVLIPRPRLARRGILIVPSPGSSRERGTHHVGVNPSTGRTATSDAEPVS